MEENCHREHGEFTEDTEGHIGIWNQSEFRLGDLIQGLCELTDPKRMRFENDGHWVAEEERDCGLATKRHEEPRK